MLCVSCSAFSKITHLFLSFLEMILSTALLSIEHENLMIQSFNQCPLKLAELKCCLLSLPGAGVLVLDPPKSTPPPVLSSFSNECIWYNSKPNTSLLFSFYTTDLFSFRSSPGEKTCLFSLFTAEFPEFWILLRLQLETTFLSFQVLTSPMFSKDQFQANCLH